MKPFYRYHIGIWDRKANRMRKLCTVSADTESHALDAVQSLYGEKVVLECSVKDRNDIGDPRPMFLPTGTLARAMVFAERLADWCKDSTKVADEAFADAYPQAVTVPICNELMAIYDGTPLYGAFRFIRQYLEAIGSYRGRNSVVQAVDIESLPWYDQCQMTLPLS